MKNFKHNMTKAAKKAHKQARQARKQSRGKQWQEAA